jgi:Tetratricopeptide repeat
VLGKENLDTLASIKNLELVPSDQGMYEQAGEMHRQVLGLWEMVLGKGHPSILTSMKSLAGVLRDQDKYEHSLPSL